MANDNSKVTPVQSDESPLDWLSTAGADVQHHLNKIHAVAQVMSLSDLQMLDNNVVPMLVGIILDEVNIVEKSLGKEIQP